MTKCLDVRILEIVFRYSLCSALITHTHSHTHRLRVYSIYIVRVVSCSRVFFVSFVLFIFPYFRRYALWSMVSSSVGLRNDALCTCAVHTTTKRNSIDMISRCDSFESFITRSVCVRDSPFRRWRTFFQFFLGFWLNCVRCTCALFYLCRSKHPNIPGEMSTAGQEPILPAVLEFPETHQEPFLRQVISDLDVNVPNFKLAPVYTLYLCAR